MSPALGAPNAQRRQTTLRFEGRLGLSGLPPPEFGSPTDGLPPLATLPRVASPLPAGAQAAQASSTKKRKAPAALVDGARPVAASLSFGYCRIKLHLRIRPWESAVRPARQTYSAEQKRKAVASIPDGLPSNEAAKRLRTVAGYERVTHEMLQR